MFSTKLRGLLPVGRRGRVKEAAVPWDPIQEASNPDTLLNMLLEMYWDCVYREVKHILHSLVELQKVEPSQIEKDRQTEGKVSGYEPFIDQVCEQPSKGKGSAARLFQSQYLEGGVHQPIHPLRSGPPANSKELKEAVAATLEQEESNSEGWIQFRARSMLQSVGFLDIDKLVEYREPDERLNVVRKGKVPQLKVEDFEGNGMPRLEPARCRFCRDIIRGVLFKCNRKQCSKDPELGPKDYFCEDCFHNKKHPQEHLVKRYKHCILDETITTDISRKLCQCTTVARIDQNGDISSLYPITENAKHRQNVNRDPKCRLFYLPGLVAAEKYQLLQDAMESRKGKRKAPLQTAPRSALHKHEAIYDADGRLEDALDADIPWHLKAFANNFPFGNTHISLMIGPLIIENGALPQFQGVLITKRNPLNYFVQPDLDETLPESLALGYGDKENYKMDNRQIFKQYRTERRNRRIKACMKQVVGGAFSGYFDRLLENEIVDDLIKASRFAPKSKEYVIDKIHEGTETVMEKMKALLQGRITAMLAKITSRLFESSVDIEWHFLNNNCQFFIDAILRYEDFGGLFGNAYYSTGQPLYLMSFVVRIESYDKAPVQQKYDVPNGQTEEYLLGFRSGRHDDSDIVDTLQEYWYDWGAFGGPIYKHQDHFPWDCTEAYQDPAPTCNTCTLSRHVWVFPFDSWSIIQLALQKDRRWYPSPSDNNKLPSPTEWLENRFKLFVAQDTLIRGAIAMARTPQLREACDWFRRSNEPRFDRLKLGGIHRAQPWSHHFEPGRFKQSYIAPWAHYTQDVRIQWYERERLVRQRQTEVPPEEKPEYYTEGRKREWLRKVEELAVPIAGAVIFGETMHLTHTDVSGVDSLAEIAAAQVEAAAQLAEAVAGVAEGIGRVGELFKNIN